MSLPSYGLGMSRSIVTRFSGLISDDFLDAVAIRCLHLDFRPFEHSANAESLLPVFIHPLACVCTHRDRSRQSMRHALNVPVAILAAHWGHLFVSVKVTIVRMTAFAQNVVTKIRIVQNRNFHYLEAHRLDVGLRDLSRVLIFPNLKLLPKCDLAFH